MIYFQWFLKKQLNDNYELELRIDFKNQLYNYGTCLLNNLIGTLYSPVPVIKKFERNSTIRSVYALIGRGGAYIDYNPLLLEETIDKKI